MRALCILIARAGSKGALLTWMLGPCGSLSAAACSSKTPCNHVRCGGRRKVTGGLKLFHDKFAKNAGEFAEYAAQFNEALRHNEQLRGCLSRVGRVSGLGYSTGLRDQGMGGIHTKTCS